MIDKIVEFLESNEQFGDDWTEEISYLNLVKRKLHRMKGKLDVIKSTCLEWYRFGCEDGYFNNEGVNAQDAFWDILKLLGVSQEEMDDFDPEEL